MLQEKESKDSKDEVIYEIFNIPPQWEVIEDLEFIPSGVTFERTLFPKY